MLYNADCIEVLKTLKPNSIDLIFADPPYFLSNGGKSVHSGKIVSVNKGDWDEKSKYDNHYSLLKNGYNNHLEYLSMAEVYGLVELSITYLMSKTI